MSELRKKYQSFLVFGTTADTTPDDLRRIRLVNFGGFWTLTLAPIIVGFQWSIGNTDELPALAYIIINAAVAVGLNKRGVNQLASGFLISGYVVGAYLVTSVAVNQTAAPYFPLFAGLLSIYLFKNSLVKHAFTIVGFASFIVLNTYQLINRPFSIEEFMPILLLVIAIYLAATKYDEEYRRNEQTIQKQSDSLIRLQEDKHKNELELKQKDIETVLANASMQKKIKENLHNELKKALKEENLEKEVGRIARELGAQNDRLDQVHIVQENMEELNSQFYGRLMEAHPKISKTELELCALIRLNLSSKEIATLRNSTENSTNVVKSRLRKKFGLSDQKLYNYLIEF